jgi:hypothetical protein
VDERGRARPDACAALIESFNTVFRKIFTKVMEQDKEDTLREGLASFFEGATGFVDLYKDAQIAEDGALPAATLLRNLEEIQIENPVDFLYNGLNELLFFQMFTAGEALPAADEEQLQKELGAIFQAISR